MSGWNKETGKFKQDPNNTQINIKKSTKNRLLKSLIEESVKRNNDRVIMDEMVNTLLDLYEKESKK
jgi:hypothetical protein